MLYERYKHQYTIYYSSSMLGIMRDRSFLTQFSANIEKCTQFLNHFYRILFFDKHSINVLNESVATMNVTLGFRLWINQKLLKTLGAMLWLDLKLVSIFGFQVGLVVIHSLAFILGAMRAVEFLASLKSDIRNIFKVFQSNDTRVQFHLSPFTYPFTWI